jgi:hypothetical protein
VRLSGRQDRVITAEQLHELGYTRTEIHGLVRRQLLFRLHRGVYAVGHRKVGSDGYLRAAYLAAGATAFHSGRCAGGLLKVCGLNTWNPELTVVGRRVRRPGITIHRTRTEPHRDELTTKRGMRCASATRVLIELAATETVDELRRMVETADRRNLLDRAKLERAFFRHAHRPGIATLKEAVADYRPRPFDKSGLERSIAAAIAKDPEIPPPTRGYMHSVRELDFWWPELALNAEADGGPYHKTPADIERDKRNDTKLATLGIQVIRITDIQWELDAAGAMQDLRAVVALRRRQN